MNERIKQLLLEAKIYDGSATQDIITCPEDLEKFAELIVRECARVYWNIDDGEVHGEYVKALKEHFGVKD